MNVYSGTYIYICIHTCTNILVCVIVYTHPHTFKYMCVSALTVHVLATRTFMRTQTLELSLQTSPPPPHSHSSSRCIPLAIHSLVDRRLHRQRNLRRRHALQVTLMLPLSGYVTAFTR